MAERERWRKILEAADFDANGATTVDFGFANLGLFPSFILGVQVLNNVKGAVKFFSLVVDVLHEYEQGRCHDKPRE